MNVTVLRSTDKPERLVCQCARGDYYDGYVGDTEYAELMESVDYDDSHIERAISYTQESDPEYHPSVAEVKDSGNKHVLAEAATISFCEKQLSRGHYGPWEHPQITFAVEGVSRVTMAQITRHRHMTFDVQSQRYVDFSETEAIVPKSLRDADHFSRETGEIELDEDELSHCRNAYKQMTEEQLDYYEDMVDAGVPTEDARFILPLGTPVNMTFSGNARTFMHLLDMRKKANAQWEIRELSERLIDELKDWMPYSYSYYDRNAPHKLSP
jgi:thymidylate synthase (FAD)